MCYYTSETNRTVPCKKQTALFTKLTVPFTKLNEPFKKRSKPNRATCVVAHFRVCVLREHFAKKERKKERRRISATKKKKYTKQYKCK